MVEHKGHIRRVQVKSTAYKRDASYKCHVTANGIPYTPEADTYPVGALIPNILLEPFQGDRADVRAQAKWQAGRWTLEMRRALDTKSPFEHFNMTINFGATGATVTITITPAAGRGSAFSPISGLVLSGVKPYEMRAAFGARTGGSTDNHDIANLKIVYQ